MASVHKCRHAPATNPYQTSEIPKDGPHAELVNHSRLFKPTLYSTQRVHCFVGWNLANITIVETDNNTLIVVDTGEDIKQMEDVWNAFQSSTEISDDAKKFPVEAVFLTHHHADHCNGTQFILDKFPNIDVWGADNLASEYAQENGLMLPLMSCRAMAQYNNLLVRAEPNSLEAAGINSGIGPVVTQSATGFVVPTKTFSTQTPYVPQCGIDLFQVVYVPSEANSEIAAYIPSRGVLLSAEVIQDHTFPNLYTLRGANFRDPLNWSRAIDCFLYLFKDAKHMVLQHGPPILNDAPNIDPNDPTSFPIVEVLTRYRDAIQFVRDQTLRWAMKGYAKEEIMHLVHLPFEQQDFKPWLQPFYGTVKHSVPAVYTGYIGWFDGDPVALNPVPRSIFSARIVEMMGGGEPVLQKAVDALKKGVDLCKKPDTVDLGKMEIQFAAELATYLIRMRPYLNETQNPASGPSPQPYGHPKHLLHVNQDEETDTIWWKARQLKSVCFTELAFREICANWYGTYLTAAHELIGENWLALNTDQMRLVTIASANAVLVTTSIDMLGVRLIAEKTRNNFTATIYISVTDTTPVYKLTIRNSILAQDVLQSVDAGGIVVAGKKDNINLLLAGDVPGGFDAMLDSPKITITPAEAKDTVKAFFANFEAGRYTHVPNIYVH